MNPTRGDVHVNRVLTNVSIAYMQAESNFIASRVFPNIPSPNQGNQYRNYDRADWTRMEAQERAPGTPSAGGGWRQGLAQFFCRVYAVHKDLDDQTLGNQDPDVNLDRSATQWVTRQLLLKREQLWVNNYFTTGVWGKDMVGVASAPTGNQFVMFDQAGANPIATIDNERLAMATQTGYLPNKLVIGPAVFNALKQNTAILDRIKYTQRGVITRELLASLFEVDELLVPYAMYNTAAEGAAASYSLFYGKAMLLVYAAPSPSVMEPSGGYTFSWTGYLGAGEQGNRIKRFRLESIASDRVEGEMAFDLKVVANDVGTFFSNVIA